MFFKIPSYTKSATYYYLLFLHEQKSKERPGCGHPLILRKLSTNITEPFAGSEHNCAHVTGPWTELMY